jgi:hypothetical protein
MTSGLNPGNTPADRVRARIAGASIALFALMLVGLFVLILRGVPDSVLTIWVTALGSVAAFAVGATAYYQSQQSDGTGRTGEVPTTDDRGPQYHGDRSDSV